MFKTAFSTIGLPDWTVDRVARSAEQWGADAVELRSFGPRGGRIASEPSESDPAKVRDAFDSVGIGVCSVATSCAFDEPIEPPVIGHAIGDTERTVRDAKRCAAIARAIGAPLLRVFAFDPPATESRRSATRRIAERLRLVTDDARNTGVRIALENGGAYCRAEEVMELVQQVGSPLIGVCWSIAATDESPDHALGTLGANLMMVRMKDRKDGMPVPLGEGELPVAEYARLLASGGFEGPVVFEWDRLWRPEIGSGEQVIPASLTKLYEWAASSKPSPVPA